MLKSYITSAIRNLLRHKWYTAVNVIGLSMGIACIIVAYVVITYAWNYDGFHANGDSIYRVLNVMEYRDVNCPFGTVPSPAGPRLRQDCPQVQRMARLEWASGSLRYQDKVFYETGLFVDNDFHGMFSFPLAAGTVDTQNINAILISNEYASRYFGDANPIGAIMTFTFEGDRKREVVVSGITAEYPQNSSIKFDVLGNIRLLIEVGIQQEEDWNSVSHNLFVQVNEPSSIPLVKQTLNGYIPLEAAANPKTVSRGYELVSLSQVARVGQNIYNNYLYAATPSSFVYGISICALLILLAACFNYVNTVLASASRRFREIGVRKVMGGGRVQLITQLLGENIILCIVALILGLCLAEVLVPALNSLYSVANLSIHYRQNPGLILFLVGVVAATGIGAGLYPAYVISSYNPVSIFRGKQRVHKVGTVSSILMTAQFAICMMGIIGSIVFAQNARYYRNLDLGYDTNTVLNLSVPNEHVFTVFKNEIRNHPGIASLAGSYINIGLRRSISLYKSGDRECEVLLYSVGHNYIETMKLRLREGRSFEEQTMSDVDDAVVINKSMAMAMGWESVSGKTITAGSKTYRVIGMVDDFMNRSILAPIMPAAFHMCRPEKYRYMQIQVRPETLAETYPYLQATWARIFPDIPFEADWQDYVIAEEIRTSESINKTMVAAGVMTIAIAIMGLYAIVSANAARRTKEIGIRKVLGASVTQIIGLVNRELAILLIAAAVVADIAGYYAMKTLMESIWTYHAGINAFALLAGNLIMVLTAAIAIGWQVWKTASANPVDSLKYE